MRVNKDISAALYKVKSGKIMKKSYFKLNIEDVMEIVSEHMAVSEGFDSFSTNTKVNKMKKDGVW